MYARSKIPHRIRTALSYSQDGIESMVIEARVKNEKWFFASMYRPGSTSVVYRTSTIEFLCERCHDEGKATFSNG